MIMGVYSASTKCVWQLFHYSNIKFEPVRICFKQVPGYVYLVSVRMAFFKLSLWLQNRYVAQYFPIDLFYSVLDIKCCSNRNTVKSSTSKPTKDQRHLNRIKNTNKVFYKSYIVCYVYCFSSNTKCFNFLFSVCISSSERMSKYVFDI